jgi:hypothetical protein
MQGESVKKLMQAFASIGYVKLISQEIAHVWMIYDFI